MKNELVSFGTALKALHQGKRIARIGWNGSGLFVFKQKQSEIPLDIVSYIQSMPRNVKDEFERRAEANQNEELITGLIRYENQMNIVYPNNTLHGYTPSTSDALADDWIILDDRIFTEDIQEPLTLGLSFGDAITALKQGKKVARLYWNGKGMYLYHVKAQEYASQTDHAKAEFGEKTPYREYLALKTAQNDIATWSPSVSDALSNDWVIL